MMRPIQEFTYDDETRTYFVHRPDDPSKPYHPITLGAILDLNANIQRYEQDWISEHDTKPTC